MMVFEIFLVGYWTYPIAPIGDAILRFSLNFTRLVYFTSLFLLAISDFRQFVYQDVCEFLGCYIDIVIMGIMPFLKLLAYHGRPPSNSIKLIAKNGKVPGFLL